MLGKTFRFLFIGAIFFFSLAACPPVLPQETPSGKEIRKEIKQYINERVKKEVQEKLKETPPENEKGGGKDVGKDEEVNENESEPRKEKENAPEEKKEVKTIKEISAVFQNFDVPENTVVAGDVSAVFASGNIKGKVKGDLNVVFGSVELGKHAEIQGDVNAVFSTLNMQQGATIKGNKNTIFSSGEGASKGIFKLGRGHRFGQGMGSLRHTIPFLGTFSFSWKILILVGYLIIALLFYLLIPKHLEAMSGAMNADMKKVFFTGLMSLLLIIPIGALLVVSIIGLLLLPVYIPLVTLALIVGKVAVAYFLGERMAKSLAWTVSPLIFLMLGIAIIQVASSVPIFGFFVWLFIITMGLGSVVVTRFGTHKN